MRFEGFGVGLDGLAVEGDSVVESVLGVGYIARVEEGARIGGVGGDVGSQLGFGGFPVGGGNGGFGFGDFRGQGLGSGLGRGGGQSRSCGRLGFRTGGGGLGVGRLRGQE